jgi:uroporphyrinogen-III synthase
MSQEIRVLSTKKLLLNQKQFLLNAGFKLIEADFIQIQYLPFQLQNTPSLLLFTSQNGVKSVLRNESINAIKNIPAICVGIKTKLLLEQNGFKVLAMQEYAEQLAPIIQSQFNSYEIAFFAGNIRRDTLPTALQQAQIKYTEYTVYENTVTDVKIKTPIQAILFYSPSGIKSYLKTHTITNEVCFCIGKTTANALNGITPNVVIANQQTIENVIIQCINYYKKHGIQSTKL